MAPHTHVHTRVQRCDVCVSQLHSRTLAQLDRASNIKGTIEVSPIADQSGFQMVYVADLIPIEDFDPRKTEQKTTVFFPEDEQTQPAIVTIITPTQNK